MSASPSVSSLQQLLARSSPPSPAAPSPPARPSPASSPLAASSSSSARGDSSPARTLRAKADRQGCGATLSSALGYGAAHSPSSSSGGGTGAATVTGPGDARARGRERGRIPRWAPADGEELEGEGREDGGAVSREENDRVEKLAEEVMWQAGDDRLEPPGPLLVIACSRIPPPSEVSHPDLLAKLRVRLEAFAQTGPYSVVLLVNPTPHAPSTAHLVSAYLSLSRTARKNVRRVCIVGGGWWTRVILGIFSSTLLSAKSARKLVQCPNLSSLAQELGVKAFTQVEFPLEVYSANAVSEKEIVLNEGDQPLPKTFGVPLAELMGVNGQRVPPVVRDCVDVLLSQGPQSVGIFRRSPSAAHVAHLRGAYDRGHPVSLAALPDAPYLAASLFKRFLRELPAPLLPRGEAWDVARACQMDDDDAAVAHVREKLLPLLAPPALALLAHLLSVLSAVAAHSGTNLMTSSNLVICLCPALIGGLGDVPTREEIEMCRVPGEVGMGTLKGLGGARTGEGNTVGGVLRVMIERYDDLFPPSSRPDLPSPTRHLDAAPSASKTTGDPRTDPAAAASAAATSGAPSSPPTRPRSTSHSSLSSTASSAASFLSSTSTASAASAASYRSTASRRSTLKLKRPPRTGATGGRGVLVEAFREEGDEEAVQRVQRVQAEGKLTLARDGEELVEKCEREERSGS